MPLEIITVINDCLQVNMMRRPDIADVLENLMYLRNTYIKKNIGIAGNLKENSVSNYKKESKESNQKEKDICAIF